MTTPYEAFQRARLEAAGMEKEATAGLALQALNQVVSVPGLVSMGGSALKFLGRGFGTKAAPSAVYRAGKSMETFGNKGQFAVNQVLNKDVIGKGPNALKLPSMTYDLSKAPGVVRHPASFIGMNVDGPQKLTLQRGAVWAGGALTLGQTANTVAGVAQGASPARQAFAPPRVPSVAPPGPAGYDPMEVKMGALKQAADEYSRLMRLLED